MSQIAMRGIPFFIVLFLLQLGCQGGMQAPDTSNIHHKWLNIPYATQSSSQQLDIYLPNEGEGPFPVIVSIHGGAFMMGDKGDGQLKPMLEGLKRGYAVVSINYRMSGEAVFPALVLDVKAAIRWIKANATQYHLKKDAIAVWGGSAGGYLCAMEGLTGGKPIFEDLNMGNAQENSQVQAVVDWFGPINFLTMDPQLQQSGNGTPDHNASNSPESKLMGQTITEIPEAVQKANPEMYITADAPPFLIMHGTRDQLVPTQQSEHFAAALKPVLGDNKVILHLLEGAKHGGPEFETAENLARVFTFLDQYLKK
jgi:acetyl esterase/lipase